jgi:hypothetical protein
MQNGTQRAKPEGLKRREAILFDALLARKGVADAALAAGYSVECLGRARWQALQGMKATIPEILWRHGLTAEAFALKLTELLDAKKKRVFVYRGRIFATRVMKDYRTRFRAVEIWARIFGLYPARRVVYSGPGVKVKVVHATPECPALPAGGGEVAGGVVSQPRNVLTEGRE